MRQEAITSPMNNPMSSYTIQSLLAVPSTVEKHIRKQLLGEYLHVGQTYLITHEIGRASCRERVLRLV